MDLIRLGWNAGRDEQFAPYLAMGFIPARVAVEDKHFYRVWTVDAELTAQVTGKFIHESRRDHSVLPKVGDWVAIKLVPNEEKAAIQAVLPRTTQITRKTSGRNTSAQILATNIETVFLVTAADPTFNTARLERMLVMGRESGARPVVILNKIDLCDDLEAKLAEATQAAGDSLVLAVCALT
ncbi:MAG TPA: GTPase RsgA, partial [Verrucomicrobiae bacterium]